MDSWTLTFTIPTALAAVALLGYVLGRGNSRQQASDQVPSHPELKRAKMIIRDLESLAERVHQDLVLHATSLERFKDRVDEMGREATPANWMSLAAEAERLLARRRSWPRRLPGPMRASASRPASSRRLLRCRPTA